MDGIGIFSLVLFLGAVVTVFRAIVVVPQGSHYTLERFGAYIRTLKPGLHFLIPLVENVGTKINMMENVLSIPSQDIITRDNAMVEVDGVIFYQVIDAARTAYEVRDLHLAMTNLVMTNIRTVMGSMDLDELLSHRERINVELMRVVDEATNPWGIKVTRAEIKDIRPPKDLVDSMARQMKAEREKRALVLEAEGERQAEILRAEGVKQSQILQAQGSREAAFLASEARERQADAEAKATAVVSQAIAKGSVQAVQYFVAQDYVKAIQALGTSENHKVIMMPLDASGILGALGGVTELLKSSDDKAKKK